MSARNTARRTAVMLAAAASGAALTLLAPASAVADHETPSPCGSAADACIDLSDNLSWLMQDGRVTYGAVPITHGKPGYETPPGTFKVSFKNKDHVSSIYDAPMPNAVFFNGGIAFHEGSLEQQSHGCIHLSWEASEVYFETLQPGDVVQVVE